MNKKTMQEENAALKNRIAMLEEEKSIHQVGPSFGRTESAEHRYSKEVQGLKKLSHKSKPDTIYYKEVDDHKNIKLWHTNGLRIGKAVGPLHPDNAVFALDEFFKNGILLSVTRPTEEQVSEYKKSEEYAKFRTAFDSDRKKRLQSRKESEVEKLTKAIATSMGVKPSEVNKLVSPENLAMAKGKL